MLQQTRVSAVIPYFEKFMVRFPDFAALARAPEADLLAYWAGLGYYYRARNLQKAAQSMEVAGVFPDTHVAIAQLPGVGSYTAAAVASIAFNLPHAAVDGNVYRVLSRITEDRTNIAAASARKHFSVIAEGLLDRNRPGDFNQAVMELGATICLPKRPQCLLCPVRELCRAHAHRTEHTLPVKVKERRSVEETRQVFVVRNGGRLLLWQRPATTRLMPGFWELPEAAQLPPGARRGQIAGTFRHGITVYSYRFEIWEAEADEPGAICQWVDEAELEHLPLSTIARKALRNYGKAVNRSLAATV